MLIPLILWEWELLSAPYFFVRDFFERNKEDYQGGLRQVSATGNWTDWCVFFLRALEAQANIQVVSQIQAHYDLMKERFREALARTIFHGGAGLCLRLPYFLEQPLHRKRRRAALYAAGLHPQTARGRPDNLIDPCIRAGSGPVFLSVNFANY